MHSRGVLEVRRIHLQCVAVQRLSGNRTCGKADGLSSRADGSKPNHKFVLGLGRVLGSRLVAVDEHVDGNVGVEVISCEVGETRGNSSLVTNTVGPLEVYVDLGDTANGCREYIAVDLDIGESVNWVILRSRGVLPRNHKLGSRGLCGICAVVKRGDLEVYQQALHQDKEAWVPGTYINTKRSRVTRVPVPLIGVH